MSLIQQNRSTNVRFVISNGTKSYFWDVKRLRFRPIYSALLWPHYIHVSEIYQNVDPDKMLLYNTIMFFSSIWPYHILMYI